MRENAAITIAFRLSVCVWHMESVYQITGQSLTIQTAYDWADALGYRHQCATVPLTRRGLSTPPGLLLICPVLDFTGDMVYA